VHELYRVCTVLLLLLQSLTQTLSFDTAKLGGFGSLEQGRFGSLPIGFLVGSSDVAAFGSSSLESLSSLVQIIYVSIQ
jgi:Trk-type K+ transport system membrane component